VLDIFVIKIRLQAARIVAVIGQLVSAGMDAP
jgi:hypothetical protein